MFQLNSRVLISKLKANRKSEQPMCKLYFSTVRTYNTISLQDNIFTGTTWIALLRLPVLGPRTLGCPC